MKRVKQEWLVWSVVAIIVIVFSALRLARIDQSLLFFGDLGRDFFVLQQWQLSGKPPLLGPQTSALPFNQSAFYFYILYPFYILLNHSLFSTLIASWVYHLLIFLAGVVVLRRSPQQLRVWLVSWFLISIQPQYVAQHRYLWNPSFVGVCLLTAYIVFEQTLTHYSRRLLALLSMSLAAATAFSYSAIPAVIAFAVLVAIKLPKRFLLFLGMLVGSVALINLPTLAFEARHGFVLTKLMIYGEKLSQSGKALPIKLENLSRFVIAGGDSRWNLIWFVVFVCVVGWVLYQKIKTKKTWLSLLDDQFVRACLPFICTFVLLLLLPISLHAHYVFGLVITGFIVISLLPWKLSAILIATLAIAWLRPNQLESYFKPAFRSTEQTLSCGAQVCQTLTEPLFVSVQAGYHPYHNGFEFKYILKESGCTVYDIETEPEKAEYMAVFSDRSTYEHGRTSYNELTQFGASTEIDRVACEGDLTVHLLQRANDRLDL